MSPNLAPGRGPCLIFWILWSFGNELVSRETVGWCHPWIDDASIIAISSPSYRRTYVRTTYARTSIESCLDKEVERVRRSFVGNWFSCSACMLVCLWLRRNGWPWRKCWHIWMTDYRFDHIHLPIPYRKFFHPKFVLRGWVCLLATKQDWDSKTCEIGFTG